MFNYEKSKAPAEALVKELGQENCATMACNLSGTDTAHELVAASVKRFGRLDLLVVNHGVWPPHDAPIDKMADTQWRSTMAINLDSVFALVKHTVAQMKKQEKSGGAAGNIVLVSSTAGQRGEAFHCDYAATKGALISMVKGLSTELARDAIYVNRSRRDGSIRICPGGSGRSCNQQTYLCHDPTRPRGHAEEIAGPILFLCSEYSGFITGEIFNVNGGAVLVAGPASAGPRTVYLSASSRGLEIPRLRASGALSPQRDTVLRAQILCI